MIGVGKMKQYSNVLDRPLGKGKQDVSLSAFAFLFSELVQYNQTQVDNIAELERKLKDAGYSVGARVLELLCHREKRNRRETRLLGILSFVHNTVWKVLFGKVVDSLEKGAEHEDEYMISEKELFVNRYDEEKQDWDDFYFSTLTVICWCNQLIRILDSECWECIIGCKMRRVLEIIPAR